MKAFPVGSAKALIYSAKGMPLKTKRLAVAVLDIVFNNSTLNKADLESKLRDLGMKEENIAKSVAAIVDAKNVGFTEESVITIFHSIGASEDMIGKLMGGLEFAKENLGLFKVQEAVPIENGLISHGTSNEETTRIVIL